MLALARIGHRLALTEEAGLEVPGLEALIKKKRKKLDDFEKNIVQPLIRMHGSLAVCQNSVEIDVGFDDEIPGSITEKDILCHEGRSCSIRVQALASGCPILTTLDLSYFNKITDVGVQALAGSCSGLTDLNLK